MVAEGAGAEERPEDPEGIDARFEAIIAGLRAEQTESAARRQEAIRQARSRRRPVRGSSQNRPLQGADDPNPWPPRPREDTAERPPEPGPASHVNPPPNFLDSSGPESSRPDSGPSESGRSESGRPESGPSESGRPASGPPASGPQESRPDESVSPESGQPETTPAGPGEAWRGYEEGDDDDHFIPPTPSLPAGDLHLWAIVVGLMGGPVLLILSNVFYLLSDGWWTTLGIALTVGGVVLLVLRLPKTRDYTDSSGGAQV